MDENVIEFRGVSKLYKLYKNDKRRLLGIFLKKIPYKEKKAVDKVSFNVKRGEAVAIFGKNGAGKSTILKMITGVTFPTSGEINVKGRVSALLELTSGFDPEFTGRENIYLKGRILGLKEKEISKLEPIIVEFAELEEYIDQPVRTYSSGMKARLGFSINVNIEPEILIVDEALSVGDEAFKKKCTKKINEIINEKIEDIVKSNDKFIFNVSVKNIGNTIGREVVQLYLSKPCGKLGNPEKILVAFVKTAELKSGESETIELIVETNQLASYDESKSAYIIESGKYEFFLGKSIRENEAVFTFEQAEDEIDCQCVQASAPIENLEVMSAYEYNGKRIIKNRKARTKEYDLGKRILENLPEEIPQTGDKGFKLADVKSGKITMEQFVAQLNNNELEAISRGDYVMNSPLGAKGNAGAFGGVLQSLRAKGIKPVITTDGPSGIRLSACCSLLPIGTLLACSFDPQLVEKVYSAVADEMFAKGSDVLLAPGMNIHRNPLCGRNFEYYSEDPYLTGKIAAAAVKGIQSHGASACPKHFACNNQEFRRNMNDSRLSERALREIYLKGFEICVREARPKNIMTSYNRINSVYGHYNYELCTAILRNEWGYNGNVITDWWMKNEKSPEFPLIRNQAYRVRAQVDVLMPGGGRIPHRKPDGTLLESLGKEGGITLGELQRTACNVLRAVIDSNA